MTFAPQLGWLRVEHEERADNRTLNSQRKDIFSLGKEKKNLLNICILAPHHISCMTSKIVSLSPSSFFFSIINKRGNTWSKIFARHRRRVPTLPLESIEVRIQSRRSVEMRPSRRRTLQQIQVHQRSCEDTESNSQLRDCKTRRRLLRSQRSRNEVDSTVKTSGRHDDDGH